MSGFDEKATNLFYQYDANRNGSLEKKEFVNYFKDMLKTLGENIPETELDSIISEGIDTFDTNKDGLLQLDEFKAMLKFLVEEKGLII